jgi:hypothetical protein
MTMTAPTWLENNRLYTADIDCGPTVVFAKDTTDPHPQYYAPFAWHDIDLTQFGVSADATFAEITGILVITDVDSYINDLQACFRSPGSALTADNYQLQATTVQSGSGYRGSQSVTVRPVNGIVQLYWKALTNGNIDTGASSFLMNLRLSKWGRSVAESGSTGGGGGTTPMTITVPPEGLNVDIVQGT